MRVTTRAGLVLVLAASALAAPTDGRMCHVDLPTSAVAAVDAFRKVPWGERCKPNRADPAPEGWQQRVRAEAALAALAGDEVGALWKLLVDPDRFVRALAARGLGLSGDQVYASVLAAALADEKDKLAKVAMVEALGRTGGPEALVAVEAQQTAGCDPDVSWMVGLARRQLKGRPWDVANLRAEFADSARAQFSVAEVGKPAPELGLPSADRPVNLAPYVGKVVVLAFTHGDRDPVGETLQRLIAAKEQMDRLEVQVIVVDPHEKERTAAWAQRMNLPFVVFASDPAARAASAYGVAKQLVVGGEWQPSPAWFVIDRKGKLVWKKICKDAKDHASLGELLPVLEDVSRSIRITDR